MFALTNSHLAAGSREGEMQMMKAASVGAKAVVLSVMTLACPVFLEGSAWAAPTEFTTDFRIEDCTFSDKGRNPYFSLNPGDVLTLADEGTTLQITVLNETRVVSFVTALGVPLSVKTRVIEERESVDGTLLEVSRNFFARCTQRGDILYFGEDTLIFENGTSTAGSWLAGQDGALPGLIMPGTFLLGSRYLQEQAPGVALDRAEHVAMGLEQSVQAGDFDGCVEVSETSSLEPGAKSTKIYCPGVGLVDDDGLTLVNFDITGK